MKGRKFLEIPTIDRELQATNDSWEKANQPLPRMSPFVDCPNQCGQHWNRRHTNNKNVLLFWEQPLCFICPFVKWVVTYFQCSILWVIHTFHVSILSQVCSWQSFLSSSRLCFPSIASFAGQKLFKFHVILLVTSCFHFLICETSFPKSLPNTTSWNTCSAFLKKFLSSGLTSRSLVHFEFLLVWDEEY